MKKYELVSQEIIKNIENNAYPHKLPTEDELVTLFDVSKSTIRKAVTALVEQGYLYRVHGSGVYVRKRDYEEMISINLARGLTKEFPKNEITTKLVSLEQTKAGEFEASKLKCEVGTNIYCVNRIRYLDGKPYLFEESLFNKELIHYLNTEIVEGSIYDYIENHLKLTISFADKYFVTELLSERVASYLELAPGTPSIVIDEKSYLEQGAIFNFSKCYYHQEAVFFCPSRN